MDRIDAVIAGYADHQAAEDAVKKLAASGFDMKNLTVVGKGYHTDEKVVGFYNVGDRVKFWGARGAYWGGLWGLLMGGVFVTVPVVGPVIVLGYLAAAAISTIEGAVVVGGLSIIGAALYSIGIPNDSVIQYETSIAADGFLVLVHGSPDDVSRAKSILGTTGAAQIDVHEGLKEIAPAPVIEHQAAE